MEPIDREGGAAGVLTPPAGAASAAPAADSVVGRRGPERSRFLFGVRSSGALYMLLLPTFLLLSVFTFVPFFWAFAASMTDYEIGAESTFVGLANYMEYFEDPTFLISFRNMMLLTVFAVAANIAVPLGIAKLIFSLKSERARYLYRILFLVPIVVPVVAQQIIWKGMIYGESGFLNELLRMFMGDAAARAWLADPDTVLPAIAFVGFPFANGINILIFYAGLTAIPESVHEAARLEGATGFRKFWAMDVPLVLSQIKLLVILTIIAGVQSFEGIFLLTRGGPGFESMVPGLWMYFNAWSFQRMGFACAIGVVLFLIIAGLTALNARYFKSSEQVQGLR